MTLQSTLYTLQLVSTHSHAYQYSSTVYWFNMWKKPKPSITKIKYTLRILKKTKEMISYRQDSSVGLANTSFGCHTTRSMSGAGGSAFGAACSCSSSGAPAPAFRAPAGGAPVAGGGTVDGDCDCASGSAAARPLACASLATRQTSACTRTRTVAHVGAGAAAARPALTASVAGGALDTGGPSCTSNANETLRYICAE